MCYSLLGAYNFGPFFFGFRVYMDYMADITASNVSLLRRHSFTTALQTHNGRRRCRYRAVGIFFQASASTAYCIHSIFKHGVLRQLILFGDRTIAATVTVGGWVTERIALCDHIIWDLFWWTSMRLGSSAFGYLRYHCAILNCSYAHLCTNRCDSSYASLAILDEIMFNRPQGTSRG